MKLAAHYIINEHGKVFKGAALHLVDDKCVDIIEMGLHIHELAQMEFHSGIIIPALPHMEAHINTLIELKNTSNCPIWLKFAPEIYHKYFYREWTCALQVNTPNLSLAEIIQIYCTTLPLLLNIAPCGFSYNSPTKAWLISGVNYPSFIIKSTSRFLELI